MEKQSRKNPFKVNFSLSIYLFIFPSYVHPERMQYLSFILYAKLFCFIHMLFFV